MTQTLFKSILIGCSAFMFGIAIDITLRTQVIIEDAQAGVARIQPVPSHRRHVPAAAAVRTTRHVIRRTNVYVVTLPPACITIVIENASLYQCGTTYYKHYGGQYVVVIVD